MTERPEINRCMGKPVPFGSEYAAECKTCARSVLLPHSPIVWMRPVTFEGKCPYKLETGGTV